MRWPSWVREALAGYRWLWRAHLRWRRGPVWMAGLAFALRVVSDVGRAALAAFDAGARSAHRAPTRITIEGRTTMAVPHPAPALPDMDASANERLKAGFGSWLWTSMIAAVVIHFATFAFWPEMTAADITSEGRVPPRIESLPDVNIPDAPEELPKPALPIPSEVDLGDQATIGVTDFDQNPVSELPPPPPDVPADVAGPSDFTPYTLAPTVLNTDEVVRAMRREYPSVLRDAGIGGTVSIVFRIDEDGRVVETVIGQGSDYESLDQAALAVADVIRFSPAMNRDRPVAVRVAFPIVFRVDDRR